MVNCFIIYYIVDRKVPGIFVFLWLFIFIEYYFFFKYPQFIPAAMICIVTQVCRAPVLSGGNPFIMRTGTDQRRSRFSSSDTSFKQTCWELQHPNPADSHTTPSTRSPRIDWPPSQRVPLSPSSGLYFLVLSQTGRGFART